MGILHSMWIILNDNEALWEFNIHHAEDMEGGAGDEGGDDDEEDDGPTGMQVNW